MCPPRGGLHNNIRGNKKNKLPSRSSRNSSSAALLSRISDNATRNALRNDPFSKVKTFCISTLGKPGPATLTPQRLQRANPERPLRPCRQCLCQIPWNHGETRVHNSCAINKHVTSSLRFTVVCDFFTTIINVCDWCNQIPWPLIVLKSLRKGIPVVHESRLNQHLLMVDASQIKLESINQTQNVVDGVWTNTAILPRGVQKSGSSTLMCWPFLVSALSGQLKSSASFVWPKPIVVSSQNEEAAPL